jgi:hypothetical protein
MLFCLLLMLQTNDSQPAAVVATHFQGELSRRGPDGFSPVDDFQLIQFADANNTRRGVVLLQASPDRNAWQQTVTSGDTPPIRYVHDGVPYQLEPVALFLDREPNVGDEWEIDRTQFSVERRLQFQDSECVEVQVRQGAARQHKLIVDIKTREVLSLEQRVFMGRGDEFKLTLQRVTDQPKITSDDQRLFAELMKLRTGDKEAKPGAASVSQTQTALPGLKKLATSRWAAELLKRIDRETTDAQSRTRKLADMQKAALGTVLAFNGLQSRGGRFDSKSLAGNVTVLHIWNYRNEPLNEPYGQVAYLDFMKDKFQGKPVKVIGINVDSRFSDKTQVQNANRSVRKLVEFMNLSYPIVGNDGSILKALGDPRAANAELPLWIVADKSQRIRVWKAGYFKVDARRGLQELEKAINELLK